MAVALSCPHCQTQLKLKSRHPTHKVARCPMCKGVVPLNDAIEERKNESVRAPTDEGTQPTTPIAPPARKAKEKPQPEAAAPEASFLAPPEQPDEIGRLGPYRVLSRIGSGGMGMVFRAEEPLLMRQVALKVMLPQYASNPIRKARFILEAKAQAQIEHEHVVAIYRAGELDGVAYIAMPLLKGQTLASALIQNPKPPLSEVLRIGREIAEGLAAAHEAGLIHRDIKPANIWLDGKRRRVKILDFGLARAADNPEIDAADASAAATTGTLTEDHALTVQGAVVGTPLYMSPEQARAEKVDHRTDLFSLGIVLYQMTAGSLPFFGYKTATVLDAVKNHHPNAPAAENLDIPQAVSDLILHLLAKSITDRPSSAEEVAERIRQLEATFNTAESAAANFGLAPNDPWRDIDTTEPTTIANSASPTVVAARMAKSQATSKRSRTPLLVGIGFFALACVAALAFTLLPRQNQQAEAEAVPPPNRAASTPAQPKPPPPPKKAFAWPAEALRDGRITLMDLSAVRLLKSDEFDDPTSGWSQGKLDSKSHAGQRGYKDGAYLIRKEREGSAVYGENVQLTGLSSFACQVDGRVFGDPAANWELSFTSEQLKKSLRVELNALGKLAVDLGETDGSKCETLFSGTHAGIKKGNEFNRLTAILTAERIEVFVNGVAVCDPLPLPLRLQPVNLALGLSGGAKSSAEFRRLSVWAADNLPTAEERLKNRDVPSKDPFHLPFAWPTVALREGRIALPDLAGLKTLRKDDFKDAASGWPQGKSDPKGPPSEHGYRAGIYYIQKDFKNGSANVLSALSVASGFVCRVEGRVSDNPNSSWDVWFGNDQLRKAIAAKITAESKYRVTTFEYGKADQQILSAGSHSAIKSGREFNEIAAIVSADRFELFVNGVAVCDPLSLPVALPRAHLGFGATGLDKCTAEFRKLSILSAEGLLPPEERSKLAISAAETH